MYDITLYGLLKSVPAKKFITNVNNKRLKDKMQDETILLEFNDL